MSKEIKIIFFRQQGWSENFIKNEFVLTTLDLSDFIFEDLGLRKKWFDELAECLYSLDLEDYLSDIGDLIKSISNDGKKDNINWYKERLIFIDNEKFINYINTLQNGDIT